MHSRHWAGSHYLKVVIKIRFRANPSAHVQDVRWEALRQQFYIVSRSLPQVAAFAKQIVNLKGMSCVEAEGMKVEINPARLGVNRIEIHDDDDDVGKIRRRFAVTNQRRVISPVE